MLHAGRGQLEAALDAFRAAEQMQVMLLTQHGLTVQVRSFILQTQVRLGQLEAARESLASDREDGQVWGESRAALAAICLAEQDPQAAVDALAPGGCPVARRTS